MLAHLSISDICMQGRVVVVTCCLIGLLFVVFLSSCNAPTQGRVAIAIRKYGFLLPPAEEEERLCLGQPSTQRALISHLDVIYCGLHRENNVYCNRDHNYHRSALSQDLCRVCVCLRMGCTVYTVIVCVCVCVFRGTFVHALIDLY